MRAIGSILLAFLCVGILHESGGATVRHVPGQYATIQAAIDACVNGDTVLVAEATYKENLVITKKITVGSAFIQDNDTSHISRTIIDGSTPRSLDSAAVVTIDGATDTTTVLAGLTLTGGKGNRRTVNYPGVPVYIMRLGTGVDIAGGGARIHHNVVRANSYTDVSGDIGGVINIFDTADKYGVSYAIIEHNTITDNALHGRDCEGGAFAIGHSAAIRHNLIARNMALGSTYDGVGAAFEVWNGFVNIEGNLIINNSASHMGGGLYLYAVQAAGVAPHVTLVNNIVSGNAAGTVGGGLWAGYSGVVVSMANNTFSANTAPSGGSGVHIENGATVSALNTILWDSTGTEIQTSSGGVLAAFYSDIRGGYPGTGNINADPLFESPGFDLGGTSPCIGAGKDTITALPVTDYYSNPRPQPAGSSPDMGAIESPLASPAKTIRHVPQPYATIQSAIDAASPGDLVLVDDGRYFENIVLTKKITVASAYVLDNDTSHISRTIIDGSQPRTLDSAAVVTIDGATDTTTVLAGFTITGGKGNARTINYPPWPLAAYRAGFGIDVAGGGARIHHNTVQKNNYTEAGSYLGAVVNIFDVADKNGVSYVIVEHNTIADNTLLAGEVDGGALAIGHSSLIRGNLIARNTASGTDLGVGGGFQIWNGLITIEDNLIIGNAVSHEGGGMYATAVPDLGLAPHIAMSNNIFEGNSAGTRGGGAIVGGADLVLTSVNNTFSANSAASGGSGISVVEGTLVHAINTIFWDTGGTEIDTSTGGRLAVSYCDIRGGYAGDGNIDADPQFVVGDPLCNLQAASPCIGRGRDSLQISGTWYRAPAYDFNGDPRHRPFGPQGPDIGAQEEQFTVDVPANAPVPLAFQLHQNYPNPFNPKTVVSYQLPAASEVQLVVYDLLGREVAVLANERKGPGTYEVKFDGTRLASGVYLYRLTARHTDGGQAGTFVQTRKMVLTK